MVKFTVSTYFEELQQLLAAYDTVQPLDNRSLKEIATVLAPNLKALAKKHDVNFVNLHLEAALDALRAQKASSQLAACRDRIRYAPKTHEDGLGSTIAFLSTVMYRPPTSVELAAFRHFIWLCKRRVFGLPARYHLMPVVVGPQGSGKTEALKKFLTMGLGVQYVLTTNFEYLEDERNTPALAKFYAVFLDEMAKASRSDVGNLKRLLTQESLTYRPLHTNDTQTIKSNVTLIGASNTGIEQLIKDDTGMRRFFELRVDRQAATTMPSEERNLHWKKLNELDYVSMWTSVNEELLLLPEFEEAKDEISRIQEDELKLTDMFAEFLAHCGYEPSPTETVGQKRRVTDLMIEYKEFLQNLGSYYDSGIDPKMFRRKLKDAGFSLQRSSGVYKVRIKASSSLQLEAKGLKDHE